MDVRVIREDRNGANHARFRGLAEARGEYVCFLDDDNLPESRFVAEALAAFLDDSTGLLVSRVYPDYEFPPPYSISRREHLLAINEKLGDRAIVWGVETLFAPTITAGMWVRRHVLLEALSSENPDSLLSGRTGSSLACGEDIEIGYLIGRSGFSRIYCPQLRVRHVIPKFRLHSDYFCRLIIGVVRSEMTLKAKYIRPHRWGGMMFYLASLVGAMTAIPFLMFRRDGLRETLFILANRWAHLLGPYPLR